MHSTTRIGYVGNDGWRSRTASYSMLDGKLKYTIHPKDTQETIHVELVTEDGSISMEMKDAETGDSFEIAGGNTKLSAEGSGAGSKREN